MRMRCDYRAADRLGERDHSIPTTDIAMREQNIALRTNPLAERILSVPTSAVSMLRYQITFDSNYRISRSFCQFGRFCNQICGFLQRDAVPRSSVFHHRVTLIGFICVIELIISTLPSCLQSDA